MNKFKINVFMKKIVIPFLFIPLLLSNLCGKQDKSNFDLTLKSTIFMALKNNISLKSRKLTPKKSRLNTIRETGKFDSLVSANQGFSLSINDSDSNSISGDVSLKRLYESGSVFEVDYSSNRSWSSSSDESFQNSLGLTYVNPLRKGRGRDVNLASIRQSRITTRKQDYELRGYIENLVADVTAIYWDCVLAKRKINIFEESLKLAEEQLKETREKIEVGQLPPAEIAASEAEIALRKEGLINAKSNLEVSRIRLFSMINPGGSLTNAAKLKLQDKPSDSEVTLENISSSVSTALKNRPEVNATIMGIKHSELELVKTKNGLLPKLDFFISVGKSGYADSFSGSFKDLGSDDFDASFGFRFEEYKHKRAKIMTHKITKLDFKMAKLALDNLKQLTELDVHLARIEIKRTLEQIKATKATSKFQNEKLRKETEKYRVGRSTSFIVAQAQRDYLSSQISEFEALIDYNKSLSRYFLMEGSLLFRSGIKAPGAKSSANEFRKNSRVKNAENAEKKKKILAQRTLRTQRKKETSRAENAEIAEKIKEKIKILNDEHRLTSIEKLREKIRNREKNKK
ncbi:TolC family protein [bacterium]|nr:TolC family protein [bacterium]